MLGEDRGERTRERMGVPRQADLQLSCSSGIPDAVCHDHSRNTGVAQQFSVRDKLPQQKYQQQLNSKSRPKVICTATVATEQASQEQFDLKPKLGSANRTKVCNTNTASLSSSNTAKVCNSNTAKLGKSVTFAAEETKRDQTNSTANFSSSANFAASKETAKEETDSKPDSHGTATFAVKETTRFDCGDTVDMWFMCRWLSSRRRRSTTPADSIQQQQQRSQEQQQGSQQPPQRPKGLGDSFLNPDHRHYDSSNRTPTMDGATDDEDGGEVEGLMLDTETDSSRDCSRHREAVAARGDTDFTDYGGAGDCSLRINAHGENPRMERDEGLREQLAMVEAMVQEMKVGFMAALEQLSSMQDAEQGGWHKVDGMCKQHDTQIIDIATSLDTLRKEVSTLSSNVGKVIGTQQSLKDQLNAMQTSQQRLMDELVTSGVLSEKSRTVLSQLEKSNKLPQVDIVLDNISGDLNIHGSSQIADAVDFHSGQVEVPKSDKTGVTAAACKSLSLIQALAARCQDIDISDSSEEDLESSPRRKHGEMRRYKTVESSADLAQRQQAVQDIVDSEQEYCRQLWSVVNCYQRPLQEGHYMSSRHLCILFPAPISELCEQHSQMLHSLQDRLVYWSYAGVVGDVFARITDSNSNLLGLYQEYVESLPASISCLRRQRAQSRNFRAFIKSQREANADMDLLSLLISPLQRIPKYMLQLQQVLCHTHEDHPDYFNLQASLSKLQDFVERFSHDITHTIQATALDLQHLQAHGSSFRSNGSGSSCEILPVTTSTRDSGIHSAEDTFPRRKRDHNMYLPNWLEHSTAYHHTDSRHGHAKGAHHWPPHPLRLASHSQPDLTYTGYSLPPSPFDHRGSVQQIRSQSTLPPSGDRSARQRRYKIKKRIEGQGRYISQTPSPQMRPASAIDFVSQREPQQRPEREHAVMRPHSVLGPFPGDGRSRVIQVYSRKQMPRGGGRQGASTVTPPLGSNSQHQARTSSQPNVNINGHWDSVATGDTGLNDHGYGLVDYTYDDDNEDDTRAMSDAPSIETSSSHKLSSRHSQDAPETETDNSEDYTPEDLAASLSHHLTGGPVRTSSWTNSDNQQLHYIASKLQVDRTDNDTDYLESPESGVITTDPHLSAMPPQQQPLEDMSELRLDLTCFNDDTEGCSSVKKSTPQPDRSPVKETSPQPQVALNMQPMAVNMNSVQSVTGNVNNNSSGGDSPSLNTTPQNHYVDETSDNAVSVTELNGNVNNATPLNSSPVKNSAAYSTAGNSSSVNSSTVNSAPKPVNTLSTDTVSWDHYERKRTLPAAKQDLLPSVSDRNNRVIHMDFDRPPLRWSATPQEHLSSVHRPIMPRSAIPSEYIMSDGVDPSLSLKFTGDSQRRNKDTKHTSAENLHCSVEDVSTVSKKKHFRTSLKNLFNRKKGSVVLDELEREYTKELVRQCLTKNGHTHTPTTHPAEAPTTNITTNDHTCADGVDTTPTNVCGHDSSDTRRGVGYGVNDNVNNNNNNNSVLHCNTDHSNGFFTRMRKSPLFFLYRNTADGNADTIV